MGKKKHSKKGVQDAGISRDDYEKDLYDLQVELVKLQNHLIKNGLKILILFEGRDTAGKDGTIKCIMQHLSPRDTRTVALSAPSDREKTLWYFQRYAQYLPAAREMVLFNRSWYNRAGVEKVLGFCTKDEYEEFMEQVPAFEQMLIRSGIVLRKYYLDITKAEQKKRLKEREQDPLKQWKVSPIDETARKNWDKYSEARNQMFARTHTAFAPWKVVRADDKRLAHLNIIRDFLVGIDYKGKSEKILQPDPNVVFAYEESYLKNGMIAP